MQIIQILIQSRRDFTAKYKCQFCKEEHEGEGYDDDYFHNSVVPKMVCKKCNKSTISENVEHSKVSPKYPEGMQL